MENLGKRDQNITSKTPVNESSIYPNPKTTFEPAILSMEKIEDDEKFPKIRKLTNWYSILSFILTLIPIILFAYCIINYLANKKPDISGTDYSSLVFSYMLIYYYTIGAPLAGFAISAGVKGLKNGLPKLAKFSLFLKMCYIITILLFMSGIIKL